MKKPLFIGQVTVLASACLFLPLPMWGAGRMLTHVRILLNQPSPALELTVSHPVVPKIEKLSNPSRWIVTLPGVEMSVASKDMLTQNPRLTSVHLEQRDHPLAVVATVQLGGTDNEYRLTRSGNVITVMMAFQPQPIKPGVPTAAYPSGRAAPAGSSGGVMLAGSTLANGTTLTAGSATTVLHLARGGELHLCPGTGVTVTSSQSGKQIMMSMNTGGLEAHYEIGPVTDSIVTPDFRMQLTGPGQFDFAITDDKQGNTCVRALAGNTSSLFVTELMGEASYQVKANEQVVFRGGRLSHYDHNVPATCGCTLSQQPTLRAEVISPPDASGPNARAAPAMKSVDPPTILESNLPTERPVTPSASLSALPPVTAPPPVTSPDDVHVQVDAPLAFNGADARPPQAAATGSTTEAAETQTGPATADTASTASTPTQQSTSPSKAEPNLAQSPSKTPHGFFGRIGSFFSTIFSR